MRDVTKADFDIKPRHHYRWNQIIANNTPFLAQRSCKKCFGTGKTGKWLNTKTAATNPTTGELFYPDKTQVYCTCLLGLPKEEEAKEEEKKDE